VELAFMTNAGKAALYLRPILEELHLEQLHPTKIAVDSRGAQQLTNAQLGCPLLLFTVSLLISLLEMDLKP
jgi:hypothetical protein